MTRDANKPRFRKVLAKATVGPVNLVVAGSAALGALALHSWPLLALGGAAYTALVAWDAANPKLWKQAAGGVRAAERLPDPARLTDPATRLAVTGILAARRDLERVLRETPREVKDHLGVALGSAAELESRAARLVVRAEELGGCRPRSCDCVRSMRRRWTRCRGT